MATTKIVTILFIIQFSFVMLIFLLTHSNDQHVRLEKQMNELLFQNQETRKILLAMNASSDSKKINSLPEDTIYKIDKSSTSSQAQITSLAEDKIEDLLSEKIIILKDELLNDVSVIPPLTQKKQIHSVDKNKNYINKNYKTVEDEYFKASLKFSDKIIDRAIYAGVFTEWDADELSIAVQDLDVDEKIFIMNKLSNAYNSEKISGQFINFKLVNQN